MTIPIEILALIAVLAVGILVLARKRPNEVAMADRRQLVLAKPLLAFVEAIHSCESEDDRRYVKAVAALRKDPEASARLITAAFDGADRELKPWLVMAANATASESMLPFLTGVAGAETPARDIDSSRLRLNAIDGLEGLAQASNAEAIGKLIALAGSEDRAVQACAIAALKFSAPAALARIAGELGASAREWLKVTRPMVNEVPQIAAVRRHLRRPGQPLVDKPSTDRSEPATTDRPNRRRSPRIHGGR